MKGSSEVILCTIQTELHLIPPGHMGELTLAGVETEKLPHHKGTLFVNKHKVYISLYIYHLYVVKHCQKLHPMGQHNFICSIGFLSAKFHVPGEKVGVMFD